MKGMRLLMTLLLVLPPLFFGDSLALTNEEATDILKELIKTEFKILEIREAPLEGFWEVVSEIGHERMVIYIHKNLRFMIHGQILDRQIKKNLTLDRLKDFRRVDPSGLPLENAIPMEKGNENSMYLLILNVISVSSSTKSLNRSKISRLFSFYTL